MSPVLSLVLLGVLLFPCSLTLGEEYRCEPCRFDPDMRRSSGDPHEDRYGEGYWRQQDEQCDSRQLLRATWRDGHCEVQNATSAVHWVHLQHPGLFAPPPPQENGEAVIRERYESEHPAWRLQYYQGGSIPEGGVLYSASNGFYKAVSAAWSRHGKLILSPDDIWMAVQAMMSRYIEANHEELRHLFVDHAGKRDLVVLMVSVTPMNWNLFLELAVHEVRKNVNATSLQRLTAEFTTTTMMHRVLNHVAILSHLKSYFRYVAQELCGISAVGYLGSLDDWARLRVSIAGLRYFHLDPSRSQFFESLNNWINRVLVVVDHFIADLHGHPPDLNFWNTVIKESPKHGSGTTDEIHGWIRLFLTNRYDSPLAVASIPSNVFKVPVTVRPQFAPEQEWKLVGGFTGVLYDTRAHSFQPQISIAALVVHTRG